MALKTKPPVPSQDHWRLPPTPARGLAHPLDDREGEGRSWWGWSHSALSPLISHKVVWAGTWALSLQGKPADSNRALGETQPVVSHNGASLDTDMKRGRSTWRKVSNPCSTTSNPGDPGQFADPPHACACLSLQLEVGYGGLTAHAVRVIGSLKANVHSQVTQCPTYSPAQSCVPAPSKCKLQEGRD